MAKRAGAMLPLGPKFLYMRHWRRFEQKYHLPLKFTTYLFYRYK